MDHASLIKHAYTDYDDHRCQARSAYLTSARRFAQIVRLIGGMGRVLDIGSSHCDLAIRLMALGKDAEGLDDSDVSVQICKEKGVRVHKVDIETDCLPDLGKFDVVLMLEIIEHLLDPVNVLRKVANLVATNGFMIISSPNAAYLKCRLDLLRGVVPSFGEDRSLAREPRPYNLLHKTPLSIVDLRSCITMAGLQLLHMEAEEYASSNLWASPGLARLRTILRNTWPTLLAGSVIVKVKPTQTY
jgi:SAM-dependent methyltransferase